MLLSFLCRVVVFLLYFVPVNVDGQFCLLFVNYCACLCFRFSIIFLLFSCQMSPSFLCLILVFLVYFVSVTVNGSLVSFVFDPL